MLDSNTWNHVTVCKRIIDIIHWMQANVYYQIRLEYLINGLSKNHVMSILLYGCIRWMQNKQIEKKLDSNCTRMPPAVLNQSWRQHPTKQQLYGHLPHILKTIQVRRTRHAGLCWRRKDKLISNVLLWNHSHGWARVGQQARTYLQQLCVDTGCSMEDLPGAMDNRNMARKGQGNLC